MISYISKLMVSKRVHSQGHWHPKRFLGKSLILLQKPAQALWLKASADKVIPPHPGRNLSEIGDFYTFFFFPLPSTANGWIWVDRGFIYLASDGDAGNEYGTRAVPDKRRKRMVGLPQVAIYRRCLLNRTRCLSPDWYLLLYLPEYLSLSTFFLSFPLPRPFRKRRNEKIVFMPVVSVLYCTVRCPPLP